MPKTVKICVIDDDDLVRDSIGSLILSLGYEADTFASAADYLACNRAGDYSCLIADVQMPCVAELVSKSLSTPIIFIGAHCTQALVRRLTKAGAIGFLLKPFTAESLIEYLAKALKSKSAE